MIFFTDLIEKATEALSNLGGAVAAYMPRLRAEARTKLMASFTASDHHTVIGIWKMGPTGPIEIDFAVEGSPAYEELIAVARRWNESRF